MKIQTILSGNTFGEWLDTINDVIDEVNKANSVFTANALVRFGDSGSFSANTINVNSITLGNTVNLIVKDFTVNNHHSLVTSKAVYDLLTQGSSGLHMTAGSISFPDNSKITGVVEDFPYDRPNNFYDNPVTANGLFKLLENNSSETEINAHFEKLHLSMGAKVKRINTNFSDIDDETLVTSRSIENHLGDSTIDLKVSQFAVNGSKPVVEIVEEFYNNNKQLITANISHNKIATTQAIKDFIGGVDKDLGTFQGQSLEINGHLVDGFSNNVSPINSNTVPTTLGVYNFLTNSFVDIVANSVIANTTSCQDALVSNSANLFGIAINAISTDLSVLNDSTLATTNAIINFFSSGGAEAVSANNLTVQGFTINSIANVIDAANTNANTIATTQGIYDLISGGVASVPPLSVSANTLSFPGSGSISVNNIANVFDTANTNNNTLLTSEAIYESLRNKTFEARLHGVTLSNGPSVENIYTTLDNATSNDDSLLTSKAVKDYVDNFLYGGGASLSLYELEMSSAGKISTPKIETPYITGKNSGAGQNTVTIEVAGTSLVVNSVGVFINGNQIS